MIFPVLPLHVCEILNVWMKSVKQDKTYLVVVVLMSMLWRLS